MDIQEKENQQCQQSPLYKRHIYCRKDGRFESRYISSADEAGKARYSSVFGKSEAEVEEKLNRIGRLYQFSKRERVADLSHIWPEAVTLNDALSTLETEFTLRGYTDATKERYKSSVRKFVAAIHKDNDVQSITIMDAKNYILNQRNVCKMAASTCNNYTEGIRMLFTHVLGRSEEFRTFPKFKGRRRLPEVLTREELELLFASFDKPMYRILAIVMYSSGLRVSEAVKLRVSDIRRDRMLISVKQGKGRKDRFAILSSRCLNELEEYWRQFKPMDYFFVSPQNRGMHVTPHAVEDNIKAAAEKAGIDKRVTPHTLRHCFGTHLIEANTGIFQTKEALGHSSLKSTQIYIHLAGLPGVKSPYDL